MKLWGADVPKNSALNKMRQRQAVVRLTTDLEKFFDNLYIEEKEETDDTELTENVYYASENFYTPRQLKWAIKKFLDFYVEKGVVTKYIIPCILATPKLVDIKLCVYIDGTRIELRVSHTFD